MTRSSRLVSILLTMSVCMMLLSPPATLATEDHQASGRGISRTSDDDDLTDLERQTLESIRQIDDYPMYVMTYYGDYGFHDYLNSETDSYSQTDHEIGCTSFAALNRSGDIIFGYNQDTWWFRVEKSVIAFTDPPNGFASVAVIRGDFSRFGQYIDNPCKSTQEFVWRAPFWPLDGMNEYGVIISPMSVEGDYVYDPEKMTLHQLAIIRLVLDYARNVNEAIYLVKQYNNYRPNSIHYLIADAYGNSAVIEYLHGRVVVTRNVEPWQISTNFPIDKAAPDSILNRCGRYAGAYMALESYQGLITEEIARDIQELVSEPGDGYDSVETVWSSVYNSTSGDVSYCFDREYDDVHRFHLPMIADLASIKTTASPTSLAAGGRTRVVATINNLSPRPSSATRINFYLSNRRRLGKRAIRIGSRRLPSIESEGKRTIRLRIDLPDDLEPGEYYLISCLNENGRNNDDNEKNNVSVYKKKIIIR